MLPFSLCAQSGVSTETSLAIQPLLSVLERIQEEQQALRDALARLQAEQTSAMENHARLLREQHVALSSRLAADRNHQLETLQELGRVALAITLSVAGVILVAMGAVAWSLLRAFQRMPLRAFNLGQPPHSHDEAGLPVLPDARLANALAALEQRVLKLGETALRPGTPIIAPVSSPSVEPASSLPGDFL